MRRGVITLAAAALVGLPAVTLADQNNQGDRGNDGGSGGALAVARLQCRNDRASMGVAAFRARYGPRHAFANCVRAHLPADRSAAQQCRAERRATGTRAFRVKYRRPDPLRNCIISKAGTT